VGPYECRIDELIEFTYGITRRGLRLK